MNNAVARLLNEPALSARKRSLKARANALRAGMAMSPDRLAQLLADIAVLSPVPSKLGRETLRVGRRILRNASHV